MLRKIVEIDESKCNGCGLCISACYEGAIELINGKAKLISDEYCDGLGDCLPKCPTDAISIIEREAKEYDEKLVLQKQLTSKNESSKGNMPCGCPGTLAKVIHRENTSCCSENKPDTFVKSQLQQWPVQLSLVNSQASYFNNADLLIAADCTAYAYADFHREFIKGHITVIGCPKLDDNKYYEEKLTDIIKNNNIKSITVVRMEVPCCGGIVSATKNAMLNSKVIIPYKEVIISTDGNLI